MVRRITYFFLEFTILSTHFFDLNLQSLKLVLFLQTTFKSTFTVLEKPSFSFAKIGAPDFLFDLINFACC